MEKHGSMFKWGNKMICVKVPVRFSLLGGGSDLSEFFMNYGDCQIISMALSYFNHITYTTTIPCINDNIHYDITTPMNNQKVSCIEEIKNDLIRIAFQEKKHDTKLKHTIVTSSDVSINGSGLGGSSSFAVGMALLFTNDKITAMHDAIDFEINKLGSDIGWQDHIISTVGGFRYITIDKQSVIHATPIIGGDLLVKHILMFALKPLRNSDGATVNNHNTLTSMKNNIEERSHAIKQSLELIPYMINAIQDHNIQEVGRILNEAWILKMESHKGDNVLMDVYNKGIEAGAYGGKVSGSLSKGAGHLFLVAPIEKHTQIIEALSPYCSYRPVSISYSGVRRCDL
jgi:D-glycero-alpha-D-manno-heptose-7-phosphate kinase